MLADEPKNKIGINVTVITACDLDTYPPCILQILCKLLAHCEYRSFDSTSRSALQAKHEGIIVNADMQLFIITQWATSTVLLGDMLGWWICWAPVSEGDAYRWSPNTWVLTDCTSFVLMQSHYFCAPHQVKLIRQTRIWILMSKSELQKDHEMSSRALRLCALDSI